MKRLLILAVAFAFACASDAFYPFPDGIEQAVFGLGCFWGAEKRMAALDGVNIDEAIKNATFAAPAAASATPRLHEKANLSEVPMMAPQGRKQQGRSTP